MAADSGSRRNREQMRRVDGPCKAHAPLPTNIRQRGCNVEDDVGEEGVDGVGAPIDHAED